MDYHIGIKSLKAVILIALVFGIETVIHQFSIPAWCVFLTIIFYILADKSRNALPLIFVGGAIGIIAAWLCHKFILLVEPSLGDFVPKLMFLGVLLFLLMVFGENVPLILNNYTFTYFLVTLGAKGYEIPLKLLAGLLLGGGAMIIGDMLIDKLFMNKGKIKENNKALNEAS